MRAQEAGGEPDPRQRLINGLIEPLPKLTEKQAECLRYILAYFQQQRHYPTRREIASRMRLNSCSADSYVRPLSAKGYLVVDQSIGRKCGRNIRLTRAALEKLRVMGEDLNGLDEPAQAETADA